MHNLLTRTRGRLMSRRPTETESNRRRKSHMLSAKAQPKVPVIVLGSGLTALGVLRSYGRAGIPVYCVAEDIGVVARSRWSKRPPGKHKSLRSPDELESFLEKLPFKKAVLVPCSDNWASAVARLSDGLSDRYLTSLPCRETLDLLVDKGRFASALRQHGVSHPRTFLIESAEQLGSLDIDDFTGSFLKPHNSHDFFKFYSVKACRVSSREDAVEHYRQKRKDGFEVLFQEYIPGPSDNHYFIDGFVDRNGRVCALFARRRLRMFPVDFGNSTYMVSVPLSEVKQAADDLRRFLPAIDYRGIFSAEFKFDERDGLYKILEINARPWWFVEFAATSGVDVCGMAYRDALGLKVPVVRQYRVGARSVHPYFDINICILLVKSGEMSLYGWARSWIGARYPVLCIDDPLPAIVWWSKRIRSKLMSSLR
ncbi:MAG: hypothetical protein KKG33_14855 [candidate division Zixibacteria bacterium]|nr:hypothetical protein [candidate division Zixibacteria bacterium]MBU1472125.1 hypothetical protein [candidate division Zixibacteria bacterium]MBU2626830.1 hypothetical protein [candidate division Zixibacteria bacterium]